jgi:prepilin-type N-terminal cleavage/methylation domain-containing protein
VSVSPDPTRRQGFTLVETVVALAVLGVVLLLGLGLLLQEPAVVERLEARQAAWDALEDTLEAVRAGDLPLSGGSYPTPQGTVVHLSVEPTPVPDLWRVQLEAEYRVQGRDFRPRIETRVWRSGG